MEILCARCFHEDDRPLMPRCKKCWRNEACGESWYQVCHWCLHFELERQWRAAIPIQTAARGFLAKKQLQKHRAARRVQALWRGYLTRAQLALK